MMSNYIGDWILQISFFLQKKKINLVQQGISQSHLL